MIPVRNTSFDFSILELTKTCKSSFYLNSSRAVKLLSCVIEAFVNRGTLNQMNCEAKIVSNLKPYTSRGTNDNPNLEKESQSYKTVVVYKR